MLRKCNHESRMHAAGYVPLFGIPGNLSIHKYFSYLSQTLSKTSLAHDLHLNDSIRFAHQPVNMNAFVMHTHQNVSTK
jgi:hypothetical protein